jgi:hypothetical protein
MSQALTVGEEAGDGAGEATDQEVERVARLYGWKPREEFRGNGDWVDARTFVARGVESPAMLLRNNKVLTEKFTGLEAKNEQTQKKLDETQGLVVTMTEMMRASESRGYERARRELKAEQAKAVASGDVAGFNEIDRQLDELDKAKPIVPAARTPPPTPTVVPTVTPTPPGTAEMHPRIRKFFADNPWYDGTNTRTDRDVEMMRLADAVHTNQPGVSIEDNITEVERVLEARFGDRFRQARSPIVQARQANGDGRIGEGGEGGARRIEADLYEDDETGRRAAGSRVTPSSGSGTPRRTGRYTFDTMPQASKDAYTRYKNAIDSQREQRGDRIAVLTKDEWARDYWAQFVDDGT